MTLVELQTKVYELTKRPDKVTETLSALQNALLKCHTQDYYTKDILETGIVFTSLAQVQSLSYKALIPLWRALSYIQPLGFDNYLNSYVPYGEPLTEWSPLNRLDEYSYNVDNIYYEAGQVLQIRTFPAFQYFQIGAYLFPDISAGSQLQTWITQDYPYAVIYDAAATIFRSIGLTDQMTEMKSAALEVRALLELSNVSATGS